MHEKRYCRRGKRKDGIIPLWLPIRLAAIDSGGLEVWTLLPFVCLLEWLVADSQPIVLHGSTFFQRHSFEQLTYTYNRSLDDICQHHQYQHQHQQKLPLELGTNQHKSESLRTAVISLGFCHFCSLPSRLLSVVFFFSLGRAQHNLACPFHHASMACQDKCQEKAGQGTGQALAHFARRGCRLTRWTQTKYTKSYKGMELAEHPEGWPTLVSLR